ncbi:MAG: error-prone DNA polymerase [Sorangiineae bacterium]|nr:error-prone DNA polymerase [Polyangiaceae bacterium]MEB2325029.1 error-prone DNA polymerase [Sorangiineae bacterium]
MHFAELLGRSNFSFLRGASHPEELVVRARELGLDALALCDRDGLYGSVRAWTQAKESGQRLIVGAECTLEPAAAREGAEPPVVALLVADHAGYANLCRLLTLAHAGRPKGESALSLEALVEGAAGLYAVVPAESPPEGLLAALRDALPDRAAIATYRHKDGFDEERHTCALAASRRFGLPIVASARPLYHHASRHALADVLTCIREGTTLDAAGTRLAPNGEARLRGPEEMARLFPDHPEWVERTAELAEGLRFGLGELRYRFPCALEPGESADDKLRRLTWEGAARRYPGGTPPEVSRQIVKELALIEQLAVAPYFISTWEIVELARARRILCQGRGSAANSAVCFALGITAVDPARSNLLFERFMSAERSEPPDIDIDFEHERREEVIQELYARYGRERAAMVSEVIRYRGKSALREVGKAFGLSLEQVERLSQSITHRSSGEATDERLRELGFDVESARLRQVVTMARALDGFPRHLSIHVGGFVLSAAPLHEVAPIEPARLEGRTVIPWDKDDLDALGFFKVDVLALGMLTALRKCLALVAPGVDPLEALAAIPPEDPAVYRLISRADTIGVFQIESRAQMSMLPRLRPRCFYDLVIEVALVRPGPIQGGMVHPYLRRRNGEEPIRFPHPALRGILERTLGVPLFQEQVMQLAIEGAGYSGGEADQLRRDMAAWRRNGRLLRHRERLLAGFAARGISAAFGEALFEQIKGFGEYGFPESHAASFALLVYASAWQKTHHPAAFACALLNAQPMGFYSPSSIIQDAQRHGVIVRDVSVTRSEWDATLEPLEEATGEGDGLPVRRGTARSDRALRLGLRLIKGFGEAAARRVVGARREAALASVEELARRARLRRDELDALAESGALEPLASGRRQALWKVRAPRLGGLFEELDEASEPAVSLPALRPVEQLVLDYERKGLSVGDHPMRHARAGLRGERVLTAAALLGAREGARIAVAGLVTCRQQPVTASGVVFLTLEDETGSASLILQRRVFERFHWVARHAALLVARGVVERQDGRGSSQSARGAELAEPPTPVVYLVVRELERLELGGIGKLSRDFY